MPIKPWLISTSIRSADRVRGFLSVLAQTEGRVWDDAAREDCQVRLIQSLFFLNHFTPDDMYLVATGKVNLPCWHMPEFNVAFSPETGVPEIYSNVQEYLDCIGKIKLFPSKFASNA